VKTTPEGLQFIRLWEGFEPKIYKDAGAGYETIGVGHLITDDDPIEKWKHRGITEAQAILLLKGDVEHAEHCVNHYISWPLKDKQFDALVSAAFNIGPNVVNPRTSTLARLLNRGEEGRVGQQLVRWNKAGGKVLAGLTKRRKAEARLFNLGEYGSGP
jgi:lysozyme